MPSSLLVAELLVLSSVPVLEALVAVEELARVAVVVETVEVAETRLVLVVALVPKTVVDWPDCAVVALVVALVVAVTVVAVVVSRLALLSDSLAQPAKVRTKAEKRPGLIRRRQLAGTLPLRGVRNLGLALR